MLKILFFSSLVLLSCTSRNEKEPEPEKEEQQEVSSAIAHVQSASGKIRGTITFQSEDEGLLVQARVKGLSPNTVFGFHVHEQGVCEGPDYESAGSHFNPTHQEHSGPYTLSRHMGDLGNLKSDAEGSAYTEILLPLPRNVSLSDFLNRAVIIHMGADDFSTQPSGSSGPRLACGVIGNENG